MKRILILLVLFLTLGVNAQEIKSGISEKEFKNPSSSFLPKTWYHVMSGNMSKAGFTKDLEAIKKAGIGGILVFNVTQGIPNGPVKYNSPKYHEIIKHAAKECERLGLSFGVHNCDGWSSSGGPWITPDESMKMVVWSEIITKGGNVKIQLPQPTARENYYRDIAVLAYPSMKSEIIDFENSPEITSSDKNFDVNIISDNRLDNESKIIKERGKDSWIQFKYKKNQKIRSAYMVFNDRKGEVILQISDDGKNFKTVHKLNNVRTGKGEWAINETFKPVKSKYFRLKLNQSMTIKEVKLVSTQCIYNFLGRTSLARTEDNDMISIGDPSSDMIIDKSKLIDITACMDSNGIIKTKLPMGKWTIMRFGYTTTDAHNHPASVEGSGLECDKFSRKAFKTHFNAFSAKVINETAKIAPDAMQYIEIDSYEMGGQNWTHGYDKIFKEDNGYDIIPFLPLYAGRFVESPKVSEAVLWDIRNENCNLMKNNYYGYFSELCHEKGIKSYIEPYGFGPLNDLDVGGKADINMGEFWMNRKMNMVQSSVSAAHIYGKNIISSESFTSTPEINWKGNPAMAKVSGDLAWTYGINQFMFHRFVHQANTYVKPGMTMNRWGFHFDRTQTWFENAGADWFKYMARGQYLLRQGNPVSDILVFVGDGSPNSVYLRNEIVPEIPAGINFDCVNADVLKNRIILKNGKMVLPEGTEYRILFLENCKKITLNTLKRIYEISKAGVPVVGAKPLELAGYIKSAEDEKTFMKLSDEIWNNTKTYSDIKWKNILGKENISPDFSIAQREDIPYIHRIFNNKDIYFFFNPDSVARHFDVSFRVKGKIPELWNPMTGEIIKTAQFKGYGAKTKVRINMEAQESMFVVFRESSKGVPNVYDEEKLKNGDYFLTDKNSLFIKTKSKTSVLNIEGPWEVEFLKKDGYKSKHIFNQLTDWKDNSNENIKYYSGTAIYRTNFNFKKDLSDTENQYILNLGDVKIVSEVILNGKNIGVDWIKPFEFNITNALVQGENKLEIKITNQWSNKLIGDERFSKSYKEKCQGTPIMDWYSKNEPMPKGKRTTFCTVSFYKSTDALMPSGLLGPVKIFSLKILQY